MARVRYLTVKLHLQKGFQLNETYSMKCSDTWAQFFTGVYLLHFDSFESKKKITDTKAALTTLVSRILS